METPIQSRPTLPRAIARLFACALVVAAPLGGRADDVRPYTTWREYGGSIDSMQYSALAHIDRSNVKRIERAWFYPVAGDPDRLPFNPIVVDDVMYVAGAKQAVVALDAATGKELWTSTEKATERGLIYWESADRTDRRLIVTTNSGIREINAKNGEMIRTFGRNGTVDMRTGNDRRLGGASKRRGSATEKRQNKEQESGKSSVTERVER